MDVQFWAATDVGRVREHNEDNFLVDKRLQLFIVADGMGGHAAGEVASAVAVRAIREVVANNRSILERHGEDADNPKYRQDLLKLLEYAVQEACTRIFDMAQQNPERRGMGTTCSLLLVVGRRSLIAHVGDSRIYLVRKGQVHQLTEDHSLVNEMMRRGRIAEGETFNAQYKNAITRAVGVYESVEVDTLDFDNLPGDRFLLCSDGLSMYLEDENLTKFARPRNENAPTHRDELRKIVEELIAYGNSRGGKDNITAVLIGMNEDSEDREAEDIRLTMETMRNIPLFHYLNYKELVRIINVTHKRRVVEGDQVIQEGEPGEELFVILRGEFVVERGGQELARLGAGRHFGEMALVDDQPRSASVRCLSGGTLLTIRRPEFYELLRKDPSMAVKLLWNFIQTLSTRLRDASPVPPAGRGPSLGLSERPMWPPPMASNERPDADTMDEIDTPGDVTLPPLAVSPTAITPEHGIPIPRGLQKPPVLRDLAEDDDLGMLATIPPGAGMRSPVASARRSPVPRTASRLTPRPDSGPAPIMGRSDFEETMPNLRLELGAEGELPQLLGTSGRPESSDEVLAGGVKRHRHRPRGEEED